MKLTTNIPANPELYLTQDDGSLEKFSVGNKVTVLMLNHNQRIGVITSAYVLLTGISHQYLTLKRCHCQM